MLVNFKQESIENIQHWIFDMDGTLTLAIHDFDEIRAQLDLPAGEPILEAIARMPKQQAQATHKRLDEIEFEIAKRASPQPGATELLDKLQASGCKIGILTRNGKAIAEATLRAAGLDGYFETDAVVSRDCCAPKPSPAGILKLLEYWQATPDDCCMAGDYLYDLQSGHDASVATIHLDVNGVFSWPEITTVGVTRLSHLLPLIK